MMNKFENYLRNNTSSLYLTPKVGLTENVKHILIYLRIVVYSL